MSFPPSAPPTIDYGARQQRLTERMFDAGLDAVALNAGPTLSYFTGLSFHLSERPVVGLFTAGAAPTIVLPAFESAKLDALAYDVEAFTYSEDPTTWEEAFRQAAVAAGLAGARVGVEPRRFRVLELRLLEAAEGTARFVSAEDTVAALRMYKDAGEIALMREAVGVAQRALHATLPRLQAGVSEREVAAEVTLQLLRGGSESELPFAPIVAFAAASANPHAVPGDRVLREGDLVLVDWGASVRGYYSDLTRMFAFGEPDPELAKITRIVADANAAGRAAARPGVAAAEVDRATRQVIEDAGYGPYFTHRTGHGLGLESHEEPYIRGDNALVLEPGMTFTVEPGIYLPGRGGARIEDDVVVTADGAESLSDLDRALVVLS